MTTRIPWCAFLILSACRGSPSQDDGGADSGGADGGALMLDAGGLDGGSFTRDAGSLEDGGINYIAAPPFVSTDWAQVLIDDWDRGRAAVRPMPNDVAKVTAPFMVWPHVGTDATRYQVNLRPVGGAVRTLTPDRDGRNWLNPGSLAPGRYEWRVQHPATLSWSDWRPFTIAADAVDYVVPDATVISTRASARAHPRSMPDELAARLVQFRAGGALYAYKTAAVTNLASRIGEALYWEDSPTFSQGLFGNQLERIPAFWWLWLIEGNTAAGRSYRDEALRRVRWFSAPYDVAQSKGFLLTETGLTSYSVNDIPATNMVRFLAFAWDAMKDQLTPLEQTNLLNALAFRLHQMTIELTAFPMRKDCLENSHDIVGTMIGALAGLSLIGDAELASMPQLQAEVAMWAKNADQVLATYNSFADQDGCHWHTLGYASTTYDRAQTLDMLSNASGVDFFSSPRALGIVESHMRMFPPDSTGPNKQWSKPFGDSSSGGEWGNVLAFEPIYATAEMALYSRMKGATMADSAALNEWFIARKPPSASTAVTPVPAVVYPGSGMGAFHSDPLDLQRTSLWFRSSQEGADSHRHLDQNSFVISSRSQPLFIDSGYYGQYGDDSYNSDHRSNFAKRSLAHNTIALNDRVGQQRFHTTADPSQLSETAARRARGRIVQFFNSAEYGFVVGDALQAYQQPGYEHSKALRAVVYLKPGVVLVFDAHDVTGAARTWNWLFHTLHQPVETGGVIGITAGTAQATLKNLYSAPAVTARRLDTSAWPPNADPGPGAPPQWHNSFDFAAGKSLRTCMLIEVATSASPVTSSSCDASGTRLTASVGYQGHTWSVVFDAATGAVVVSTSP